MGAEARIVREGRHRPEGGSAAATAGEMAQTRSLTAIIGKEGDGYVALCPELDVASQGASVEEARANLREALELFFETADPSEVASRLQSEVFVTSVDVAVG